MKFGSKNRVITDEALVNEFLTRSVERIYPDTESLRKALLSGKQLSFYFGIDPTGPSIHVGHLIPLLSLSRLQALGHKVTLLIGDFTAMIGDPTDKTAARKALTKKEVLSNLKDYKKQASKIIKFSGGNGAKIVFNSSWLSKMDFGDVLTLASKMTVDQMLKRDMFEKRMSEGKPVYIHEFMYPLMQGYDSVALETDGEIGGNDQTFNMLTGRDLEREILGKQKFVLTTKLLTDPSGKKMGKSEGNMVSLSDEPRDVFGKVMSWGDGMIVPSLEYCTLVPLSEVERVKNNLANGSNPRDEKKKLAYALTELCFGTKSAQDAEKSFEQTFSKKEMPQDADEITLGKGDDLSVILVSRGIVSSKTELRRLIEAGAITDMKSGEKLSVDTLKETVSRDLKIGKHRFVKVRV